MSAKTSRMGHRRNVKVVILAATCVALAACGSQVSPQDYIKAQGNLAGYNNGNGNNNGNNGGVLPGDGTGTVNPTATGPGGVLPTGSNNGSNNGGNNGSNNGGNNGGAGPAQGATAGLTAGSCAGFKNQTGVSNSTITLANVADLTGPVPGLFTGAQQAMKAYVAYFNSSSSICGRKLALALGDSQTSSGGDQQATTSACGKAFAMVGSMGAFDSGGAAAGASCGIPDLRVAATEQKRIDQPNVYGAMSLNSSWQPTQPAQFYKQKYPGVEKAAAFLWLNAGAAASNGQKQMNAYKKLGYNVVYSAGIDVTAFNYTTYVSKMVEKKVKFVAFIGAVQYAVRLAKAMDSQHFKPMYVLDPEFYDPQYVSSGGSAVEGTHIWANQLPFEDVNSSPEMQKYFQWLQRVAPGAKPNYFGQFAWAAGALFVKLAYQLGGKLTRPAFLTALRGVDNFTGNGLFGPQHVGAKKTGSCYGFIQLQGGKWVRESGSPRPYGCASVIKV